MPKYYEFLSAFPTFRSLARAALPDVLQRWQGLGYNRRAKALRRTAMEVVSSYAGKLPSSHDTLCTLPGIGPYTASAIRAFAFDQPAVFIETNIRTVFLHFFFPESNEVHDRSLLAIVEETLPRKAFREWFYALMDYGAYLKAEGYSLNKQSSHYRPQTRFEGSLRQVRGKIIRELLTCTTGAFSNTTHHHSSAKLQHE